MSWNGSWRFVDADGLVTTKQVSNSTSAQLLADLTTFLQNANLSEPMSINLSTAQVRTAGSPLGAQTANAAPKVQAVAGVEGTPAPAAPVQAAPAASTQETPAAATATPAATPEAAAPATN